LLTAAAFLAVVTVMLVYALTDFGGMAKFFNDIRWHGLHSLSWFADVIEVERVNHQQS
jgi:hypothetical protein